MKGFSFRHESFFPGFIHSVRVSTWTKAGSHHHDTYEIDIAGAIRTSISLSSFLYFALFYGSGASHCQQWGAPKRSSGCGMSDTAISQIPNVLCSSPCHPSVIYLASKCSVIICDITWNGNEICAQQLHRSANVEKCWVAFDKFSFWKVWVKVLHSSFRIFLFHYFYYH